MASITDIVRAGRGKAGHWQVVPDYNGSKVTHLFHYSHKMLTWNKDNPSDESVLDYDTGWGSVSDQNGMNKAFRTLGLSLYYTRKGGAEIYNPWDYMRR